jgi:pimeloyl-ACP methyl ester carboxylesterase
MSLPIAHHWKGNGNERLMLCHGFLGSSAVWSEVLPHLEPHFKLLLPDLPGHGATKALPGDASIDAYADCLIRLLDTEHIDRIDLLGHSMGGYIGLNLLRRFPERIGKLILLHSTCSADSPERAHNRLRAESLVRRNRELYIRAVIRGLFPSGFIEEQTVQLTRAEEIGLRVPAEAVVHALQAMRTRSSSCDLIENKRVHLISGTSDPVLPWSELEPIHRAVGIDRQATLPCGHMGMLECPKKLSELLIGFLQR